MTKDVEAQLLDEARRALGEGEDVLAAGVFGIADLRHAQVKGSMLGGVGGALVPGDLAWIAGTVLGGLFAKHHAAAREGASLALLVAVTPTTIHVLNRDSSGQLEAEYASFERATTAVDIRPVGLSRRLTLTDAASGASIELLGSAGGLSANVEGDTAVLAVLSAG
jgi:hypothetical protein